MKSTRTLFTAVLLAPLTAVNATDGYATHCLCSPSRAGLMSGMYQHRFGFEYNSGPALYADPDYTPGKRDADPIIRNGEPVQPAKYLTDQFADEAVGFIERSKEKLFFLYFAFNAVYSPMDQSQSIERFLTLTGKRKIYAGMLSALDDAVGSVLSKVRALGQEENTLIMFYADNGGPTLQTTSPNRNLRSSKRSKLRLHNGHRR